MRVRERYLTSSSRLDRIYTVIWLPDRDPDVIVQIAHGMTEHIGRYSEFAQFLCDNGIGVIGHDFLGHGKSVSGSSQYGYFAARHGDEALVLDLRKVAAFAKKEYPAASLFLLGHSMGTLVIRDALRKDSAAWKGVLLCGTLFVNRPTALAGSAIASVLRTVKGDFYRSAFLYQLMFGRFDTPFREDAVKSWLTSDPQKLAEWEQDPACHFRFTVSACRDLFRILRRIAGRKGTKGVRKSLPVLLASGKLDAAGAFGRGPEEVCRCLKAEGLTHVSLKLYDACRHEILNEQNRMEIYRDLLGWIVWVQSLPSANARGAGRTRKKALKKKI